MSLVQFHILFIFVSSMSMVALEYWSVKMYLEHGEWIGLWTLPVGFVIGLALIFYAGWFYRTYIQGGRFRN